MKHRSVGLGMFAVLCFVTTGSIFAAQRGTPEYEKLKEYKKSQHEKKTAAGPQEKNFWQREAERSGFAGTAAMFGNSVTGITHLGKHNPAKGAK